MHKTYQGFLKILLFVSWFLVLGSPALSYFPKDLKSIADDFDPAKSKWKYVMAQHNLREKERLLQRARLMDMCDPLRADCLVTVLACYNCYCRDDERRKYGFEALAILIQALERNEGRPDLPQRNSALEEEIGRQLENGGDDFKGAIYDLKNMDSLVCAGDAALFQKMLVGQTREACEKIHSLSPQERSMRKEAISRIRVKIQSTKLKAGKPDHELAKLYGKMGSYLSSLGQFTQAIDAYKEALRIDGLCYPDKSITFRDYTGSGLGFSSPLARDHLALGDAYMEMKQYREAVKHFSAGLGIVEAALDRDVSESVAIKRDRESLEIGLYAASRLAGLLSKR